MRYGSLVRAVWLVGSGFSTLLVPACLSSGDGAASGGRGGAGGAVLPGGTGGAAPGGTGGATGGAGTSGGGGQPASTCPEVPVPLRTSGAVVELEAELALGGKPVVFGEPTQLAGGGTVLPLNVRFYVSEVALLVAGSDSIPVDMVGGDGKPVPYGVHLVNAEDSESLRFRLLAPPGSYVGVSFTLGITDACNRGPDTRKAPLSAASQMVWPHTGGYLFLRYEAKVTPAADQAAAADGGAGTGNPPGSIHVGGIIGRVYATRVTASGAVAASSGAVTRARLQLSLDELFRMARTDIDVTGSVLLPFPEIVLGERVRRLAPESALFVLLPP